MPIRVIRYAGCVETPWKNGGGVTREIARSNQGGEPEWRISLASIDRDGPFSDFTGYDRTIVSIGGAGFELTFDDGSAVILDRPGIPFRFAGERKVACRLLDGRSRDLNVMTLRALLEHEVTALGLSGTPSFLDVAAGSFVFFSGAASARCENDTIDLHDGDTLVAGEAMRVEVRAASENAFALTIRFSRRA